MKEPRYLDKKLFTADPSAHVFNGRLYVYPSHDIDAGIPENDFGDHFDMRDYHVYSMDSIGGEITDHGVALDVKDVPWAGRQMWAPDAAEKDGKYYLYFPLKNDDDVFFLGVAVGDKPEGPFVAEPEPIKGSYSIDPAVLQDDDGSYYAYFGGLWGGQLQRWNDNTYHPEFTEQEPVGNEPARGPRVAKLTDDMLQFAEEVKEIEILDENGKALICDDHERRYFEGPWMHKYNGKYYFSYSTGDTHNICYAIGDSPYGPFTYQGVLLKPVLGWTNHHSVVEFKGKWYLFFHDSSLSGGKTHLRSVKFVEFEYNDDGTINPIDAYVEP